MEQKHIELIKKILKHTKELNNYFCCLDDESIESLFKENSDIVKESIGYFNYSEELLRKILDNINENKIDNDYFKKFEKPISLEDRKKLSPDCIKEFLENPEIINKFEPK